MVRELVVLSGKGGTGKTSVTASFAMLAENAVLADCDVDAADLHLILQPEVEQQQTFYSGHTASIRQEDCMQCGACLAHCRFGAIQTDGKGAGEACFEVDPFACEGCGVCVAFCPVQCIDFPEQACGESYLSRTRRGPMVHARLNIAAENSGKLVTHVRNMAQAIAKKEEKNLLLVDGPPGIGCPVIASATGASAVLIVTEPSLSGAHDLKRLMTLTSHFQIPTYLCVNKWDIHPEQAEQMEKEARTRGVKPLGRIGYDKSMTTAQIQGRAVVELEDSPAAAQVRDLWNNIHTILETLPDAS